MNEEHKLYVFHEKELEIILERLGLLDKMEKKQLRCYVCGKVINRKNLGAITKKKEELIVLCDDCISFYTNKESDVV